MGRIRRSPLAAGLASWLIPGAGQLLTGARAAGWMLIASSSAAVVLTVWGVVHADSLDLIGMVTNPDLILVLIAINLVVGLLRLLSVTDAWQRAGGVFRVGLTVMVLLTVVPHAAIAYVGLETRATIMAVFPDEPAVAAPATTTSTTTTTLPADPAVPPWTLPGGTTTTTLPPTTTTTIPLGAEQVTFLLLGGDAGPGRAGLRTDTVMVVTVDTLSGRTAIFGLPRNMGGLYFSDGTEFPGMYTGILNEVYRYGEKNPNRFDGTDPGITAVRDVVSTLLGIPIDHHILVEMQGFAEVVDHMGGVTVNPRREFVAPLYYDDPADYEMITFSPGSQRLDGAHALAYARSRTESNDYRRMERQRCLVTSLIESASPIRMMSGLVGILDVMERRVTTDIPANRLPFLINFAPRIDTDQITFVGFDDDYRSGEYTITGVAKADIPHIQETVAQVVSGQWDGEVTNLAVSSDVCG